MENFQSKFQKGLNNIQKELEKGKSKFQTSQELINLSDEVKQLEELRSLSILNLGEIAYGKIRNQSIDENLIAPIAERIQELDKEIFLLLKEIDEKSMEGKANVCECGTLLTSDDKFCKECGKEVKEEETDATTIICKNCDTSIPAVNKFCNCCGSKI